MGYTLGLPVFERRLLGAIMPSWLSSYKGLERVLHLLACQHVGFRLGSVSQSKELVEFSLWIKL